MSDSIEVLGPDGMQVLTGDAARAYLNLQTIVTGKRRLHFDRLQAKREGLQVPEGDPAELQPLVELARQHLSAPYSEQVVAAAQSWMRMLADPAAEPEWTEGELPIVKAWEAELAAAERMQSGMTETERALDFLAGWVRDLRKVSALGLGPRSAPHWLRMQRQELARWRERDAPGSAHLIDEAQSILDQLQRDFG